VGNACRPSGFARGRHTSRTGQDYQQFWCRRSSFHIRPAYVSVATICLARETGQCYRPAVRYDWNPAKNAGNVVKHGVPFSAMNGFGWDTAYVRGDLRNSQDEIRLSAIVPVNDRLYHVTFTIRCPLVWIISLRRASNKEIARYEADQA